MTAVAITDTGDCLTSLGRWDEAAGLYQESIKCGEQLMDRRLVACNKCQLGLARTLQGHHAEALEIYYEAQSIFESLGEPLTVAGIWNQIGILHTEERQFEQAERSYRQSLSLRVQQKDLIGEADSLLGLGHLYDVMGRLEDAVKCHRQATDRYVELESQRYEGAARTNLASTLIKLQSYDDARRELLRAVECGKPFGHTVEPWKTWSILYGLERATGHPTAAIQARQQAIESYLSYRRAGGQSMNAGAQLCNRAAQAITVQDTTELEELLAQVSGEDAIPASGKLLISKLQAILRGEREPALAADPNLDYDDTVELQLLLEAL